MIYILWATIRPKVFIEAHKKWIDRATDPSKIKTIICTNKEESLLSEFDNRIFRTDKIGVCGPCYHLSSNLKCEDDDIVIFASDDFLPPYYWQDYLNLKFKNRSGVLLCRDGYQLPDSSNMQYPVITIPIMTGSSLKKMNGIIYHPIYNHMYSDAELYINAKELGLLIDDRLTDTTTFEHMHYAAGKRVFDSADKAYTDKWADDSSTWEVRKSMSVEQRLAVL